MIKPLWSPVVDLLGTRRRWIWAMQLLIGAALAGVALAVPAPHFFRWTLAFFWLLAFDSATHDIAADGFYMLATTEKRAGLLRRRAQHVLPRRHDRRPGAAGDAGRHDREPAPANLRLAWSVAMGVLAVAVPGVRALAPLRPAAAGRRPARATRAGSRSFVREFLATFGSFFRKPRIVVLLLFLLLYRFGEAQLVKMVSPFLLDPRGAGRAGTDHHRRSASSTARSASSR